MNFGEILKSLREEADITQDKLGREIGKNRSSIAGYETSGKMPEFETFIKIADYFKVSADYLLGRSSSKIVANTMSELIEQNPGIDDVINAYAVNPVYRDLFSIVSKMDIDQVRKLMEIGRIISS